MLKKILLILGIIILILTILIGVLKYYPHPEIKKAQLNNLDDLDSYIQEVVEENGLPSMAVAILDSSGLKYLSASGVRKIGGATKVTDQDLYHLGSNTKAMTAVLTGMLIDDGLLNWHTKIIDVFSDYSDIIHGDYHDITVQELLTHTSGVKANTGRKNIFSELEIGQRRLKVILENLKEPSSNKRGEFMYSNLGYLIAGTMLQQLTGMPWESLMKERLFKPLGMASANFGIPGTMGREDQPWGHIKPSALTPWIPLQIDNLETLGPAGTVHCSTEDWGKFISFQFLKKDTSLLSSLQRSRLLNPNISNYACGWGVSELDWATGLVYSHAGSNTANFSQSWTAPDMNLAILINSNGAYKNMRTIFKNVRNSILEALDNEVI